ISSAQSQPIRKNKQCWFIFFCNGRKTCRVIIKSNGWSICAERNYIAWPATICKIHLQRIVQSVKCGWRCRSGGNYILSRCICIDGYGKSFETATVDRFILHQGSYAYWPVDECIAIERGIAGIAEKGWNSRFNLRD